MILAGEALCRMESLSPPISPCIFFYWRMKGNANEIFIPAEFLDGQCELPRRGQTDPHNGKGRIKGGGRCSVSLFPLPLGAVTPCIVRSFASPAVFDKTKATVLPFCLFIYFLLFISVLLL